MTCDFTPSAKPWAGVHDQDHDGCNSVKPQAVTVGSVTALGREGGRGFRPMVAAPSGLVGR
jgi:hypothetical protein